MKSNCRFVNIIGQEGAKRKLNLLLDGYKKTRVLPHLMIVGEKGCGKTMVAREVGNSLLDDEKRPKSFHEINCASIQDVQGLLNTIYVQEGTIFFDEASEFKREISMALLTILNPNAENRNVFNYLGRRYLFDFTKITFIFATTEPQKVFHALMNRCEMVDLEPYTIQDLGTILKNGVNASIDETTLANMASVVRGNPRDAQKMATNLNNFAASKKLMALGMADWEAFKYAMGILPLGLHKNELQVLGCLKEGPSRLSSIASRLGLTPSSIQRYFEAHLIRTKLIKTENGFRELTEAGKSYIQAINTLS